MGVSAARGDNHFVDGLASSFSLLHDLARCINVSQGTSWRITRRKVNYVRITTGYPSSLQRKRRRTPAAERGGNAQPQRNPPNPDKEVTRPIYVQHRVKLWPFPPEVTLDIQNADL